eukprot:Nitzschia sp. Nitz4//scaffold67_size101165//30892//32226//NITZ4_004524-RA/size101165-processed-gene-0.37-mRNA-1//1//CDS//3329556459//5146//frame0
MNTFPNEIQLLPRWTVDTRKLEICKNPPKHQFYKYHFLSDAPRILIALEVIQHRPCVDHLVLDFMYLLNDEVRIKLADLLGKNDRSWSMSLSFIRSQRTETTDLRMALSPLANVRHLHLGPIELFGADPRSIIESLPSMKKLACLNVEQWKLLPHDLEYLFASPVAPYLTGVGMNGASNLGDLVFSGDISPHIHTIQVNMVNTSAEEVSALIEAVVVLPALKELRVVLPACTRGHKEPIEALLSWLRNDKCTVKDLMFRLGRRSPDQLSMILKEIPNFTSVKRLRLDALTLMTNDDVSLFHALQNAPSIEFLILKELSFGDYYYGTDSLHCALPFKILQFQLACRPRLMSFYLATTRDMPATDTASMQIHRITRVYELVKKVDRTLHTSSLPLSLWQIALETLDKVSDDEPVDAMDMKALGRATTFDILQMLLGDPHRLVGLQH